MSKSFLHTKQWSDWRQHLWQIRFADKGLPPHCELCKRKVKYPHLHHVYQRPTEYEILEEDRFKYLCSGCHSQIHDIFNRKCSPNSDLQKFKNSLSEYISL
jgi:hypothetical protein